MMVELGCYYSMCRASRFGAERKLFVFLGTAVFSHM